MGREGIEPPNGAAELIYSQRPLTTWISAQAMNKHYNNYSRHARVLSPYPPQSGGGALGVSGIQVHHQHASGFPLQARGNDNSAIIHSSSEPTARLELATLRLQGGCSAAELRRRAYPCPKHAARATTSSPLRRNYTIRVIPVKMRRRQRRQIVLVIEGVVKDHFQRFQSAIANS